MKRKLLIKIIYLLLSISLTLLLIFLFTPESLEVLFSPNYAPFDVGVTIKVSCGDNICQSFAGEDCNTCSIDCGACASAGGGGGGGGGGEKAYGTPKITDFSIDKEALSISLNQRETESRLLIIDNIGNRELDFNITTTGSIKDLIRIRETEFRILSGERKTVVLDFTALDSTIPDIYPGGIIIQAAGIEKIVFVAVEVESKKPLFDVVVKIPEEFSIVKPGEDINAQIDITDIGKAGLVNVVLEEAIKDSEGNIILEKKVTESVDTQISFIETIKTPGEIELGKYVFYVRVIYNEQTAIGSDIFEVERKYPLLLYIIIFLIIVLISAIIYYNVSVEKRKVRKKKRALSRK
ncbi:MAG: hypothetical protein ACE5ES_03670 [Candidatus Nanoarchaeia archaeon]